MLNYSLSIFVKWKNTIVCIPSFSHFLPLSLSLSACVSVKQVKQI